MTATEGNPQQRMEDTCILVADDSLVVRSVLKKQLQEHGYTVAEAVDGEDALRMCRESPPDVVLLPGQADVGEGWAGLQQQLDTWGIPTLKIHCSWGDTELAMSKDIAVQAGEMLAAAGAKDIQIFQQINPPGLAIHEMGTARMGRDPKTSVLNAHNQAHDIKNLFMPDGACMVSSSCVNPSLTYMALTARACDFAVSEMKKNNL